MKKYNIIYADPAWSFKNKNTGGSMKSGSKDQYEIMSLNDIKNISVESICADDCVLFMWWVASQPIEALEVMFAWGFELKTMTGFTWVKKTKHWKDWFGMGFWTRMGTENMLIAVRGNPKRISAGIRQVINVNNFNESVECVCEKHSKKPKIFADRIVDLCGDLPRVELFARDKKNGWDVWGNEVESNVII
jgi:N6-adenosine-specific RNA methylase IME4